MGQSASLQSEDERGVGFLDRLFGGRFTQPPPDEPQLSDAAIMQKLHLFRDELKAFT